MTVTLLPLISLPAFSASSDIPTLHLLQAERLSDLRKAYQADHAADSQSPTGQASSSNSALRPGARELAVKVVAHADKVIDSPIFTITRNKEKFFRNSGITDARDFYSTAPYYWPDPSKPDGLPYIRRDGEHNPERAKLSDQKELDGLISAVGPLTLAYYVTGEERYAASASRLLRAFFLDPNTRMNPNMTHAQAVLGVNTGRSIGIIDTLAFSQLSDCIALLSPSAAWTSEDRAAMRSWWRDFGDWLQHSAPGKQEGAAHNNHGTNYDLQLAGVLFGAGDEEGARKVLGISVPSRMDSQIKPDGQQPEEEARTTSWHYSNFNLRSFCKLAVMAQSLGINIWSHQAPDGSGSLKKAMLFLIPYLSHPKEWKFQEISTFSDEGSRPWLALGGVEYEDASIRAARDQFATPDKLDLFDWLSVPDKRP